MIKSGKNCSLVTKLKELRNKATSNRKSFTEEQLNKPITFWIKNDRLLNDRGKEFTIILRTKGCSWALSDSGGCSMCGYINDSSLNQLTDENLMNQVDYAFQSSEIRAKKDNYILKIFNSGSFFDESEISEEVRNYIYQKVLGCDNIKEFVIESRIEHITKKKIASLKEQLNNKYIELAFGLETVDDYIRNVYINKGMLFEDFKKVIGITKNSGIGVRTYLLFKPPFLNEQGAIDDCVKSIITLNNLGIDTISINPLNIQKGTLVEYLWYQNRYRPPWFYSLFKSLRKVYNLSKNLKIPRIISDPTGSGTKRGIHNCLKRDCNQKMLGVLRDFVLSQDFAYLNNMDRQNCECLLKYRLQKKYH
ncbi:MAG: archaeosine biosynthesis radical SAM protein RaSEA [Candidatus Hodarchaeota archaeon]